MQRWPTFMSAFRHQTWVWLLLTVVIGTMLISCGRRTRPVPKGRVLPKTLNFKVRVRPEGALLSWLDRSLEPVELHGGELGFRLLVELISPRCLECEPVQNEELQLTEQQLRREFGQIFTLLPTRHEDVLYRVSIVTRFGRGENLPSPPLRFHPLVSLPAHQLHWEFPESAGFNDSPTAIARAGERPSQIPGATAVRLYWLRRSEGRFAVLGGAGPPVWRTRYFKANLYRRIIPPSVQPPESPAGWSYIPLNSKPISANFMEVPHPPKLGLNVQFSAGSRVEYQIRLVDQFGNEGPPSNTVAIAMDNEPR